MEIIGTVKTILPMQEGVSSKGNAYKKLTVVITYDEKYPKDLAFTLFNTKIDELSPMILGASQENKPMKFFIDVTSREYNGKWYTEATCWKAESLQQSAPMPGAMPGGFPPQGYPQQPFPQGYPQQGYPQQGYPQQGFPPQGFPPQGQQPYLPQNDPFASAPNYAGPTNESPF